VKAFLGRVRTVYFKGRPNEALLRGTLALRRALAPLYASLNGGPRELDVSGWLAGNGRMLGKYLKAALAVEEALLTRRPAVG
jgi:hypothetical protein